MARAFRILVVFLLYLIPSFGFAHAKNLSLEEKIGQLLMVHFHGDAPNEEARTLIQDTKVGGIIYYEWANSLHSPEQVHALSTGLQELAKVNSSSIPLLIAIDQEGGLVSRLNKGFTLFPGNRALEAADDLSLAKAVAFAMGQELQAVGINMNLAPVVDVNSNPKNPVIGIRSFGEEPKVVAAFGKKTLKGYKKAQVIATLKHFPGYGDVAVDPHEDLPVISKTKQELQSIELVPFVKLAPYAEAIMTAHTLVPALDPDNCSTLSKRTLSYLRDPIDFQGVIMADSLIMEGVVKKCGSVDEAAIQALDAGCDILILGGKLLFGQQAGFELTVPDIQRVHRALVDAVRSGRIPEARIDEAVKRVLKLKKKHPLFKTSNTPLEEVINTKAHRALAQKVACRALKAVKKEKGLALSLHNMAVFAPELVKENLDQTSFLNVGTIEPSFFNYQVPSALEFESAAQKAEGADTLFICSYNAWKNPSQVAFIQSLLDTGKPTVLLVMRDSLDVALFPSAKLIFTAFSPSPPSIEAVYKKLKKQAK